ncbi:hypothetical protein XNC3_3450002 [Xenorhabdus nematophila F1]|nr:hypothetical protein XNC3_3450002 [Xenorhabdus nematophila F1]
MNSEATENYETKPKKANNNLAQMAASQRGALLVEHYKKIAVHAESETVYHYNSATWETVSDNELRRAMVAFFDQHDTPYSPNGNLRHEITNSGHWRTTTGFNRVQQWRVCVINTTIYPTPAGTLANES